MLGSGRGAKPLGPADLEEALELCALNPIANVFVAARLMEGGLHGLGGGLGIRDEDGELRSMTWAAANVVPVNADEHDRTLYAARLRRGRRRYSSLFGPSEAVLDLWQKLGRQVSSPMSLRPNQPVMVANAQTRELGIGGDERVRPALIREVDAVVPAAAAMFTEEIGYAPFVGSDVTYRRGVAQLIAAGRTYVVMDGSTVRFKADVGSLAFGVAQIQGVWIHPAWRGQGLAAGCMAQVADLVLAEHASTVTLYVNDYNIRAFRAYERAGFEQVGTFATVIL